MDILSKAIYGFGGLKDKGPSPVFTRLSIYLTLIPNLSGKTEDGWRETLFLIKQPQPQQTQNLTIWP